MSEFRYALRSLVRHPSHSIVAVLTLGLAIAAATAMFTVLNAVVLRPLPYPESERLVLIRDQWLPRFPEFSVSPGRALRWQERTHSFDGIAASQNIDMILTAAGDPLRFRGAGVNANFFQVIGTQPLMGRVFRADETDENVIVIAESLWRTRFGAAQDVIGKTIQINSTPMQVIGVMPASFALPGTSQAWAIWTFTPDERRRYGSHYAAAYGRVKKGVTIEAARQDLAQTAASLAKEIPDSNAEWTTLLFPLKEYAIRDVRLSIIVLMAAVGGVLLIACANVANLLLARGLGRSREFALRAAIGASRFRIIRQMAIENAVTGIAASAIGIGLGWGLLKAMLAVAPATLPRAASIELDAATLSVGLVLAIITPLFFGLLPAWQMSRTDLSALVSAGGRSGGPTLSMRTRAALIIVEVTLSVVLVAASLLLIRSFDRLVSVSPGFNGENAVSFTLSLPQAKYKDGPSRDQFYSTLMARLEGMPGVEAAGGTHAMPMVGDHVSGIEIDTPVPEGTSAPSTNFFAVTPGYFKAMGIPILRGRAFTIADSADGQQVTIINETLAKKYFNGTDPIGHKVRVGQGQKPEFAEIVGVVGDVKSYGLDDEKERLQTYQPRAQHAYFGQMTVIVRSAMSVDAANAAVRSVMKDLDPNLPMANFRTVQAIIDGASGSMRFTTMLLGFFSATALVLAAIGVYGLVSFTVGQRRKEIGIRMALGAKRMSVVQSVLRQGVGLTLIGVVCGLGASFWATRLIESQLFHVSAHDPVAFGVAPAVLIVAAVIACLVPMYRALTVDPASALRQ